MAMQTELQHPRLSREVADHLLLLLSTDDDFRDLFSTDVKAALALVGYTAVYPSGPRAQPGAGEPLFCMTATSLAPKEEIAAARDQLLVFLTQFTDHRVVFSFEAGEVARTVNLLVPPTPPRVAGTGEPTRRNHAEQPLPAY